MQAAHQQPASAVDQSAAAAAAVKALSRKDKGAASASQNNQRKPAQIHYPFWFGGSASSMAACVTHPLDLGMLTILPEHEMRAAVANTPWRSQSTMRSANKSPHKSRGS